MKKLLLFCILLPFLTLYAQVIKKDVVILTEESSVIVEAVVKELKYSWKEDERGRHIYTDVTFEQNRLFKGVMGSKSFHLEVIGGTVNDTTEWVSDQRSFSKGERVILFLKGYPYKLTDGLQGKITIYGDDLFVENKRISIDEFADRINSIQFKKNGDGADIKIGRDRDQIRQKFQKTTAAPNLVPYKPSAWGDKIVVNTSSPVTADGANLKESDELYVGWAVLNSGDMDITGSFNISLYVDGVLNNTWNRTTGLQQGYYVYVNTYNIGTLSAGSHQIKIVLDPANSVAESNETDNEYTKTISIEAVANLPRITNITPPSASAGTNSTVVITGENFGSSQGSSRVEFYYVSGEPKISAPVTSWSNTQIICTVPTGTINDYPASAGSGPVTVVTSAGTSAGYNFDVPFGYGGVKWSSNPSYKINENWNGGTGEGAAFQAAANTWNAAGSSFLFNYAGTTSATTSSRNFSNDLCFGSTSGSIATTYYWSLAGVILECDIVFNNTMTWGTTGSAGAYDIQSIALHEFGHWLNLRDLYGPGDAGRVMYGFGSTGELKRSLTSGDAAGINWIYPTTQPPLPEAPSLALPADNSQNISRTPTLSWSAVSGAIYYNLEVASDASFNNIIQTFSGITTTSKTINTLDYNTKYYWRVNATNNVGTGNWSSAWSFTTEPLLPPDAPVLSSPVSGSTGLNTELNLAWNASARATAYGLQVSKDAGFTQLVFNQNGLTNLSQPISSLTPFTTYYWRVNASNSSGSSSWSQVWNFKTLLVAPQAPQLAQPANGAQDVSITPTLQWNSSLNADSYELVVASDAGFSQIVFSQSFISALSKTINNLENNKNYYWKVKAVNSAGSSVWSDVWQFRTINPLPGTPVLINPPNQASALNLPVTLRWNETVFTDFYKLQIANDVSFSTIFLEINNYSDTVYTAASLQEGSNYYWRVKSFNAVGEGPWSEAFSFSTFLNLPAVPLLLAPVNGATGVSTGPKLVWKKVSNASKYGLVVSTSQDFSSFIVNNEDVTDTSYTLSGLANNMKYYWKVKASNSAGSGNWSGTGSFTTTGLPPEPPSLSTPVNNSTGVDIETNLVWNAVANAETYSLQISSSSDFSSIFYQRGGITENSDKPGNLIPNTSYFWRVKAANSLGSSDWSAVWKFTTGMPLPKSPQLLQPLSNAQNLTQPVELRWKKTAYTVSYKLEISKTVGFENTVYSFSELADTTFLLSGLDNGTKYFWRVAGKNSEGTGAWSEISNFTTILIPPNSPLQISPANGFDRVSIYPRLQWSKSSGANNYNLQVSSDINFGTIISDITGLTDTLYTHPKLNNNFQYYWRVRAANNAGTSQWSPVWSFKTTGLPPEKPQLVQPAEGEKNLPTETMLIWNAAPGADSYDLEISSNKTFTAIVFQQSGITLNSAIAAALLPNSTYYWRVKSVNTLGSSDWSDVRSFSTGIFAPPAAPQLVLPADNSANIIMNPLVSWNPVMGAETYSLDVSKAQDFSTFILRKTALTETSFQLSALTPNTKYYWRVNASNTYGAGAWSKVFSFTTQLPALVSTPTGLDFGKTSVNTPMITKQVTIFNQSIANIKILKTSISGDTAAFKVVEEIKNETLAPGSSKTVSVSFHPLLRKIYTSNLIIENSDYIEPFLSVSLTGLGDGASNVKSDKERIDYGNVSWGKYPSEKVILTNSGNLEYKISETSIDGKDKNSFKISKTTFGIKPGCADTILITCNPELPAGKKEARLLVKAADLNDMDISVLLFSETNIPALQKSVSKIEFKDQRIGAEISSDFMISNDGNDTLFIENIFLDGPFAQEYQIEGGLSNIKLAPSDKKTFSVIFKPLDEGNRFARIAIISNDPVKPEDQIILLGIGVVGIPGKPVLISPMAGDNINPENSVFVWRKQKNVNEYNFQISTDSLFRFFTANKNSADTSIAVNLENGKIYYWRVRAGNSMGWGEFSEPRKVIANPGLPFMPQLAFPDNGNKNMLSEISFIWVQSKNSESYNLQLSKDELFTKIEKDITEIKSYTVIVAGLESNTEYYWRVRGANNSGFGNWSLPFMFTTKLMPPGINRPENDTVPKTKDFSLSWNKVNGALYYDLQISEDPSFNPLLFSYNGLTDTCCLMNKLKGHRKYFYRIRTASADGLSDWSKVYSFMTSNTNPPKAILKTPVNDQLINLVYPNAKVTFSWLKSIDEDDDEIIYNFLIFSGVSELFVTTLKDTTVSIDLMSHLKINQRYYWIVTAYDGFSSTVSDTLNFKTSNKVVGVESINELPGVTFLEQNYPNPFNPSTTISFTISDEDRNRAAKIEIFNTLGEIVRTYDFNNGFNTGKNSAVWDGKDRNGKTLPSSVYYYRLSIGSQKFIKRMLLLK